MALGDISIANKVFKLDQVRENPAKYFAVLEPVKTAGSWAECLCTSASSPLRVKIVRSGSLLRLDGWPLDGHRHHPDCHFRKVEALRKARSEDVDAAIKFGANGMDVNLDITLSPARQSPSPAKPTAEPQGARSSRRSTSLFGFLRRAWQEAGLNHWEASAAYRSWGTCASSLEEAIGEGKIKGESTGRLLHTIRHFDKEQQKQIDEEFDRFIASLKRPPAPDMRGLIIGEINQLGTAPSGDRWISLRQNFRKYYLTTRLLEQTEKSYRHAWPAIGNESARVITLLFVDFQHKYPRIIDLCAMLCSKRFIACDSMPEVLMANRLTDEKRSFDKPFDLTDDDMLPDFVLLDTPKPIDIEVYGLNGQEDYERRKREKQAIRASKGIQCVEWNVDRQRLDEIRFPPVRGH